MGCVQCERDVAIQLNWEPVSGKLQCCAPSLCLWTEALCWHLLAASCQEDRMTAYPLTVLY